MLRTAFTTCPTARGVRLVDDTSDKIAAHELRVVEQVMSRNPELETLAFPEVQALLDLSVEVVGVVQRGMRHAVCEVR